MNYLAHLHLAGPHSAAQLGGLYGDFIKGPLQGRWPVAVEEGIRQHRRIDAFTDSHPLIVAARSRFPSERRRFAGILLDLFFDHCLAANWQDYSSEPLDNFTARIYHLLQTQAELPGRLSHIAPRMAAHDWLGSYRQFEVLEQVLVNTGRRLSRPHPLAEGMRDLERLYQPLLADFRAFYPHLQAFARQP
ncbi:ACP phosphodiesterase [Azomonas macrocytogenes]|uniref:Acyl carrier protein phosphodiesterase n=1 Tax=Azomonas macrocytogenes TaxID=69962 RepID=A0A839SYB4_AZOMA|nr:ACP phosphodiesterase [Azomonas macrocytogenes]MBB3101689.1 acyl carrier protein phosphodiesterase [Azomonas macrocytogenes]